MPADPPVRPRPDASHGFYPSRAARYDQELAAFEPLRRHAIAWLDPQPGDTVLDLGCGTGLSLDGLQQAVGPRGRVLGVEPCPAMFEQARQRLQAAGWPQVSLQPCSAERARWPARADGALCHFTHDLLQSEAALDHLVRHLRPGAPVVACGLCWAAPWNWAGNAFVMGAALYSVQALQALLQPWALLARHLPDLQVERTWGGTIYLARGTVPA